MKYNNNIVEEYLNEIEVNPNFWEKKLSLEFCIAFKLKQIGAAFSVCDNFVNAYNRGKKTNNFFVANMLSETLYQKALSLNNTAALSEYFQLFVKDTNKTTESFISINNELTPIKENEKVSFDNFKKIAWPELSKFDEDSIQLRYFKEKEIRDFYFSRFLKKLEQLSHEKQVETFVHFIKTQISISEKFYHSNYIQNEMGIDDIEEALIKKFVKKDDTFLSKLKTKFKNLI